MHVALAYRLLVEHSLLSSRMAVRQCGQDKCWCKRCQDTPPEMPAHTQTAEEAASVAPAASAAAEDGKQQPKYVGIEANQRTYWEYVDFVEVPANLDVLRCFLMLILCRTSALCHTSAGTSHFRSPSTLRCGAHRERFIQRVLHTGRGSFCCGSGGSRWQRQWLRIKDYAYA